MLENCVYNNVAERLRVKNNRFQTSCKCAPAIQSVCETFASSLDDREHAYDAQQTEEHQSSRAGRRLGKHLLTANILFDRTVIPMVDYPHPLVDV